MVPPIRTNNPSGVASAHRGQVIFVRPLCQGSTRDGALECDNCPTIASTNQANADAAVTRLGDAMGDACDPDDDNGGYFDSAEAHLGNGRASALRRREPDLAVRLRRGRQRPGQLWQGLGPR